jgi:MFS family permease
MAADWTKKHNAGDSAEADPAAAGADPTRADPTRADQPQAESAGPQQPAVKPGKHIGAKLIAILILVVIAVIAYFVLSAYLPRAWSQTVASMVHRSFGLGILYGLVIGFVFVLLPLMALRQVFRRSPGWALRIIMVIIAVVLAIPNLLTLGIVASSGNAARAGDQILNVDAPAFRGSSLGGAVLAVLVFALVQVLLLGRRRTKAKIKKAEEQARDAGEPELK